MAAPTLLGALEDAAAACEVLAFNLSAVEPGSFSELEGEVHYHYVARTPSASGVRAT